MVGFTDGFVFPKLLMAARETEPAAGRPRQEKGLLRMARRTLQIRVVSASGSNGDSTRISVELPDGELQTYSSLEEMPPELRSLAEPLFNPSSARSLRRRLLKGQRKSSSDPAQRTDIDQLPARRRTQSAPAVEGGRRRRTREIIHLWFDLWAAGGGLAVAGFPLALARGSLFGSDSWTVWTVCALLLSIAGLYLMLAFLLNHTTLTANQDGLNVRHGPLPWYGNRFIPRDDLRQLFVRVRNSGRMTEYNLCARTTFGTCDLLGSLHQPDLLRSYEQELEEYFEIQDLPVRGSQYR